MEANLKYPKIDASEAIKALGINHPVHFVPKRLNDPFLTLITGQSTAAEVVADHPPVDTVYVDWDKIASGARNRLKDLGGNLMSPEGAIAHELVHVRQFQGMSQAELDAANAGDHAPRERQAYELESKYAPLVHITY